MFDQRLDAWNGVKEIYESGGCVNESGLQAALYRKLSEQYPDRKIVVEPACHATGERPDIVVIQNDEITDIFELKFAPHDCPRHYLHDIEKLLSYRKRCARTTWTLV